MDELYSDFALMFAVHDDAYLSFFMMVPYQNQGPEAKFFFTLLIKIIHLKNKFYTILKQVHSWWQCNILVFSGPHFIWGSKNKNSFTSYIEIKYLTDRFCSKFAYSLICAIVPYQR